MAKKGSSSKRWINEHVNDPYVKQAKVLGYRSRAVFKLLELQERDKIFKPGMTVVDLGAAPGGWSQVLVPMLGKHGRIIALDILPMEPLGKVEFIQGDFTEEAVLCQLLNHVGDTKINWVISDLAPNISGIESVDQPRSMALTELALDFALEVLAQGGGFLTKAFQGEGFDAMLVLIKKNFTKVVIRKPKASRERSREVYILASGKR
jgi:23S rRNA (uridine2552-2'-O)-methyltransferase